MLTTTALTAGLRRWAEALERAAPELNERDGRLGDGDLGATLEKCAANVRATLDGAPAGDDLGVMLRGCAVACSKASGSSFGTLLAVAFLTAAKGVAGRSEIAWTDLAPLLATVRDAVSARGGAKLGDKTALDSLEAIRIAIDGLDDPAAQRAAAGRALTEALERFREQPNRIGRARMFAERSIGLDDPGMVACLRMVEGL
jgi:phosphoenolpyruvate---glycerone phosphotransferase subunit DhaL